MISMFHFINYYTINLLLIFIYLIFLSINFEIDILNISSSSRLSLADIIENNALVRNNSYLLSIKISEIIFVILFILNYKSLIYGLQKYKILLIILFFLFISTSISILNLNEKQIFITILYMIKILELLFIFFIVKVFFLKSFFKHFQLFFFIYWFFLLILSILYFNIHSFFLIQDLDRVIFFSIFAILSMYLIKVSFDKKNNYIVLSILLPSLSIIIFQGKNSIIICFILSILYLFLSEYFQSKLKKKLVFLYIFILFLLMTFSQSFISDKFKDIGSTSIFDLNKEKYFFININEHNLQSLNNESNQEYINLKFNNITTVLYSQKLLYVTPQDSKKKDIISQYIDLQISDYLVLLLKNCSIHPLNIYRNGLNQYSPLAESNNLRICKFINSFTNKKYFSIIGHGPQSEIFKFDITSESIFSSTYINFGLIGLLILTYILFITFNILNKKYLPIFFYIFILGFFINTLYLFNLLSFFIIFCIYINISKQVKDLN